MKSRYVNTSTTLLCHLTSRGLERFLQALRPHPNSQINFASGCLVNKAHAIAAQELSLQGDNEWLAANRCRKCRRPFRRTLCGTFPINGML